MLREVEVLMSLGRFAAARARVSVAGGAFPDSADVVELEARLHATELQRQSLDGEDEEALLQQLQKKIRWARPPEKATEIVSLGASSEVSRT